MKPIEEIYEDKEYEWSDYSPMLSSIAEVVLQVDDDDYQGDSRVLFKDGNRWGILIFGWGSCSGCDALQMCSTLKEVDELRRSIAESVMWFDSTKEALKWVEMHDWEVSYSDKEKNKEFVEQAIKLLASES